jgi:hypothetical protein
LGVDGEGVGKEDHKYILLQAADEHGKKAYYVENPDGLGTVECLEFLFSLPTNAKLFAFAFNYDLTKLLADVSTQALFFLFRPDLRRRPATSKGKGPLPVSWEGYKLNLQGTRFSVTKDGRTIVIWDLFRFYQSKFVTALKNWKVGNQELWDRMSAMKDQRSDFSQEDLDRIREYCREECVCMAQLARKLVDAHTAAGLHLTSFYGAGSCAAAIMKKMGVMKHSAEVPLEMAHAVSSAFFGGRFENSVIGLVDQPVYNFDISSAYPYQLTFLPCLKCSHWEWRTNETDVDRCSLVKFSLPEPEETGGELFERITKKGAECWGPFPFRDEDGSICFPSAIGEGWTWGAEFLVGKKYWPRVQYRGHWHLVRKCKHKPFEMIPHYYRERLKLGKEGAGIVLKLGPNSCYGKLAQSVGKGEFRNWIWAGMVTSGCRAQLLELMGLHEDMSHIKMLATDGLFTTEDITPPTPLDTETFNTPKPLGGWERKEHERGLFCVRPGIYFPPNPTPDEIGTVKGRGLGKATVMDNWKRIVDSWEQYGVKRTVRVGKVTIFCGAKTTITRSGKAPSYTYKRAVKGGANRAGYGQWYSRVAILSLTPWPKRRPDPEPDGSLRLRSCKGLTSKAYGKANMCEDTALLRSLDEMLTEQPDTDFDEFM